MGSFSRFTSLSCKVCLLFCIAHVPHESLAAERFSKTLQDGVGEAAGTSEDSIEATTPFKEVEVLQIETVRDRGLDLEPATKLPSCGELRSCTRKLHRDTIPPDVRLDALHPQASPPSAESARVSSSRWRRGLSSIGRFWSRLKVNLTRTNAAIRSNRIVLVACYLFYAILATACLFGWSSTSRIVALQGGFSDACRNQSALTASSENAADAPLSLINDGYICTEQKEQVEQFYREVRLVSGLMAGVAGLLYNALGPRVTAVAGQVLNIVSWSLLAVSTSSFRLHPYALVLMGSAVAFSVFPFVSLRGLFPERPHFILTVLGTAVSYSGVTPRIMTLLQQKSRLSQRAIITGYILIGLVPSLCIALFLMPGSSPPQHREGQPWSPEALEIAAGYEMNDPVDPSFESLAQGLQGTAQHDRAFVPPEVAEEHLTLQRRRARDRSTSTSSSRSLRGRLQFSLYRVVSQIWSVHFALITWYLLTGYVAAEFFDDVSVEGTGCQAPTWNLTEHLAAFFWCVLQGNAVTSVAIVRTMVCVSVFGWLMHFIPLVASGPEAESAARDFYLLFRPFFRWHSFTAIERAFGTSASASLAGFATMVSEVLHYVIRMVADEFVRTSSQRVILRVVFVILHSLQFLCLYLLNRYGRRRSVEDAAAEYTLATLTDRPDFSSDAGTGKE